MKYKILPIFMPQYACPFKCVFCNQELISGEKEKVTFERIKKQILKGLELHQENEVELAFYGGNFTAIPLEIQRRYLELANSFDRIKSIRISTRPDCIDDEILEFLKRYNVKIIEIGIQSMFDDVLIKTNRGHTSQDSINAMKLIKEHNFLLGAQVMIGLPSSDIGKDIKTAEIVCEYKPDFARIYPTLVIKNTQLEIMFKKGEYKPLELKEAILISAKVKKIFIKNNVKVIRVGLQPTEEINYNAEVLAGPFHPSFGELVDSEVIFERIISVLQPSGSWENINIYVHPKHYSKLVGQKKQNLKRLIKTYNCCKVNILYKYYQPWIIEIEAKKERFFIDISGL